jgi:tetratricopeptide (TPR) repeat protein
MAYKIAPSPLAAACSAYCMARLRQPAGVIGVSLGALKQGAVSPVLLNNLGFSYRQMSQLDEAELYLRQALRADDTLQAASHNLLMVFRDRAFRGQGVSDEALAHARRVLETGQPSGELYRDLAQLYACAAKRDPKLVASAIECVRRAVEAGADPAELGNNPTFSGLRKDKAFAEALTARVVQRYPRPGYYVDPLDAADMAAGE